MNIDKRSQLMDVLTNIFNYTLALQEEYIKNSPYSQLSISEMHVIEAVELENEPTMSNVANRLMITTGTLTTSTNKIIQKGFLKKEISDDDKRVSFLVLTELGKQAFQVHRDFHEDIENVILSQMAEEDYLFIFETLTKVYSGLISKKWDTLNT